MIGVPGCNYKSLLVTCYPTKLAHFLLYTPLCESRYKTLLIYFFQLLAI